ncbi:MAG TPA: LLM class flavin-dependent oxidoreductase [Actinomycetota bacterium]|nr:LLM class flavin-dependent oxidoreductase [Actinomycetota bacterium]
MSGVRVGVTLPQFTDDASVFDDGVRRAQDLGFDSIWVLDHLWPLHAKHRPILEGWTSLAWAAAATTEITVGTLVTRSSLRHPAVLAKMAATVSEIAPGRLCVGIGSGDNLNAAENLGFGIPYWTGDDRKSQLASTVEVLHRFREDGALTIADDFVAIDGLPAGPGPRSYSIWVGGRSVAVLDVAGRLADGWNAWAVPPEEVANAAAALRKIARDRPFDVTWGGQVVVAETDEQARARLGKRNPVHYVTGSPATVGRYLRSLVEAGAQHLVLASPFASERKSYELLARVREEELGGSVTPGR